MTEILMTISHEIENIDPTDYWVTITVKILGWPDKDNNIIFQFYNNSLLGFEIQTKNTVINIDELNLIQEKVIDYYNKNFILNHKK